jgi:hypothetical protein
MNELLGKLTKPAYILALTFIIMIGLYFGFNKFQETLNLNAELQIQLEEERARNIVPAGTQTEASESATNTESIGVTEDENPHVDIPRSGSQNQVINTSIKDTVNILTVDEKKKTEDLPIAVEIPKTEVQEEKPMIEVVHVGQTIFEDGYGGTYGAYGVTVNISPIGGEIAIPMTTSDTLGTGVNGFSYTVVGAKSFSGKRDSEISLCTRKSDGFCKFGDGQSKELKLTVWAFPAEDGTGEYAVQFNKLNYYFNGEKKTLDLNQKTESLYLQY